MNDGMQLNLEEYIHTLALDFNQHTAQKRHKKHHMVLSLKSSAVYDFQWEYVTIQMHCKRDHLIAHLISWYLQWATLLTICVN